MFNLYADKLVDCLQTRQTKYQPNVAVFIY